MFFTSLKIVISALLATAVPEKMPEQKQPQKQQIQPDSTGKANSPVVRLPDTIRIEGRFYEFEDEFYFYDRYRTRRYPKHKYYIDNGKAHHRVITPVRMRYEPAFRRYPQPKGVKPPKGRPPRKPGPVKRHRRWSR